MCKMKFIIGMTLAAILASSSTGSVISIDLPSNVTNSAMTAGVVPMAHWNNIPFQAVPIPLVDDTGADIGATMTIDSPHGNVIAWNANVTFEEPGDNTIMGGHVYIAGDMSLDFTGIPYPEYDVYVYYNSGVIYNHQIFSIGEQSLLAGDAPDADQGGPDSEYVESAYAYDAGGFACENGNYVVLEDITGSAFTLDVTRDTDRGTGYTYLSGIQIVKIMLPGDANDDGVVNADDASILASNWQMATGASWFQGDFNNDGAVDDIDATILATNWQTTSTAAVPEPNTFVLLSCAVCLLFVRRRTK